MLRMNKALPRLICLVRGHRRKFDTYPTRGACIRCGSPHPTDGR